VNQGHKRLHQSWGMQAMPCNVTAVEFGLEASMCPENLLMGLLVRCWTTVHVLPPWSSLVALFCLHLKNLTEIVQWQVALQQSLRQKLEDLYSLSYPGVVRSKLKLMEQFQIRRSTPTVCIFTFLLNFEFNFIRHIPPVRFDQN
jgi:hypothetical protein